jgi:hypothetical protein
MHNTISSPTTWVIVHGMASPNVSAHFRGTKTLLPFQQMWSPHDWNRRISLYIGVAVEMFSGLPSALGSLTQG